MVLKNDTDSLNTDTMNQNGCSSMKRSSRKYYCVIAVGLLLFMVGISAIAQIQVTGTVNGPEGAVPGVNVMIKNTTQGTVSDLTGTFRIEVPSGDAILVFSAIGYYTKEIVVGNQTVINVELEVELTGLDEVVVIGYGKSEAKDLTAPIPVIKQDELKAIPTASPMEAIQGKVSGVFISSNGAPGATPSIQIRGLGSVRGDFSPLYVIDGIITKSIGNLDINSIESISILKDASAASIYGNRAANGVILVTTKRGFEGPARINYEGYYGLQIPYTRGFDLLDREQYIEFTNRKLQVDNARNGTSYLPFDPEDYSDETDWFDYILRNAVTQKHSISISGGSRSNKYFVGLNLLRQEGVVRKNDYERVNLRVVDDIVLNEYLRAGVSTDFSVTRINHLAENLLVQAYESPPIYHPMNSDGTWTNPDLLGFGQFYNVAATLDHWHMVDPFGPRNISNMYLELTPVKGLSFKTSLSTDISSWERRQYNEEWDVTIYQSDDSNQLTKSSGRTFNYVWDNTLTYQLVLDRHRITAMAGTSVASYFTNSLMGSNTGVINYGPESLYLVNGDNSYAQQSGDGGSKRVNQSYFGRISYSFLDRYLFTGTLRGDGSSSFPKQNRWGYFPSAGLGWILSQEDFMGNVSLIDFMKLRASYGELGNSDIPQATYVLPVDQRPYLSVIFGPYNSTTVTQGATITTAAQPDLTWEVVKEFNIGFESRMLSSRLDMELDYFHRLTANAIFPVTLSATSGVSTAAGGSTRSFLANNADILNSGVELMLNWGDQPNPDFSYQIGMNLTFQENVIRELKTGTISIFEGYRNASVSSEGRPIGEFYVYEVDGVFQNMDEINSYINEDGELLMPNAVPGDFRYADKNGDGTIDDFDKVYRGNYLPDWMYGLHLGLNYRGIDFLASFQGVSGVSIFNAKRIARSGNENIDQDFFNKMWNGKGTSTSYPNGDLLGGRNNDPNTFNIESGDYFRLKNVTLGYTFLRNQKDRKLPEIRVYLSATNPFTIHGYNGFTPEIPGGTATARGYDYGLYPIASTYLIGVSIGF